MESGPSPEHRTDFAIDFTKAMDRYVAFYRLEHEETKAKVVSEKYIQAFKTALLAASIAENYLTSANPELISRLGGLELPPADDASLVTIFTGGVRASGLEDVVFRDIPIDDELISPAHPKYSRIYRYRFVDPLVARNMQPEHQSREEILHKLISE